MTKKEALEKIEELKKFIEKEEEEPSPPIIPYIAKSEKILNARLTPGQ